LSKSGTDGAEGLTQTSTTESSFAAVSSSATVPESYEEVQSQESPALVEHDDMGVSMDTPTNSLDNSALLQNTTTNSKNSATKVQDHGKFPIPGDSQVLDSEYHSVDQFRVPGSFPSTPPRGGSTRSQESSSVKGGIHVQAQKYVQVTDMRRLFILAINQCFVHVLLGALIFHLPPR